MFDAVVWCPQEEGGVSELSAHHKAGQGRLLTEEEKGRHQRKKPFSGIWVLGIGQELKRWGEGGTLAGRGGGGVADRAPGLGPALL